MENEKTIVSCEGCGLIFESYYIYKWDISGEKADEVPKDIYCKKCR